MVKLGNGKSERLFELKSVVARPPFFRRDKAGLLTGRLGLLYELPSGAQILFIPGVTVR